MKKQMLSKYENKWIKNYSEISEILFTFSVIAMPLLTNVKSPLPSLTTGDLIFLIATIILFFNKKEFTLLITPTTFFIAYIIISFFSMMLINCEIYPEDGIIIVVLRFVKFILCISILTCFNFQYSLNENFAFKTLLIICLVSSIYVMIQQLFRIMDLYLPNAITYIAKVDDYITEDISNATYYRPSGLFLEPSHMSKYCLFFLIWSLFGKKQEKKLLILTLITTIGILLTGSGIGIMGVACIYLFYLLIKLKNNILFIFLLTILFAILTILLDISFFKSAFERIFSDNVIGGNAIEARIGQGYNLFLSKSNIEMVIGSSFGNVPSKIYLSGFEYILNTIGIIGFIMFVLTIFTWSINTKYWGKLIILYWIIVMFGAQVFSTAYFNFVYSLVLFSKNKTRDKSNKNININS